MDEIANDTASAYAGDVGMRGYVRAMAGRRDEAIASAKLLDARGAKEPAAIAAAAMIYLGLGENEKAMSGFLATTHTTFMPSSNRFGVRMPCARGAPEPRSRGRSG